jgi:ABC-type lipoprotein export system ATPase subunit
MISLQNVSRTFFLDDEASITPVRQVNLTITPGEFILLIGRSGSGKTTLLNLAAGLIRPTSGKVYVKGTDISGLTDRQLSNLRARTIGFVFQFPSLIPSLNVWENTALPCFLSAEIDKSSAKERSSVLLHKLGLGARLGAFPRQLSAGEQKRVVLARALMNRPEILMADEPTSDLDERTEEEIMAVFRELHSAGTTILMVTHNTVLLPHASRTMKMENGNLVNFN